MQKRTKLKMAKRWTDIWSANENKLIWYVQSVDKFVDSLSPENRKLVQKVVLQLHRHPYRVGATTLYSNPDVDNTGLKLLEKAGFVATLGYLVGRTLAEHSKSIFKRVNEGSDSISLKWLILEDRLGINKANV